MRTNYFLVGVVVVVVFFFQIVIATPGRLIDVLGNYNVLYINFLNDFVMVMIIMTIHFCSCYMLP